LYDFANSAFATLVITFIYGTYFTQAIAPDPIIGTALWSRAITLSALVVAISSPFLGALADRGGYRKRFVFVFTLISVLATATLYRVLPGEAYAALALVVIANIGFEFGEVFYNAFLADVAPPERVGRVSGYGWGLGYLGGLSALGLALALFVQPDVPWFGFSTEAGENIRATNLLVAVWFGVFSLPLFLFVAEDKSRISAAGRIVTDTARQLVGTFRELSRYRQIVRFLVARLFYNDGLVTIYAFGGIYAAETFGFTLEDVLIFGIALNLSAGAGALLMGHLDDWIGGKRTIVVSLLGLIAATFIAVLARSPEAFWIAGVLTGIFFGPNQAASRSLMARFVPPDAENEFFGFFAFSGKLTAFIGPFLLGVITQTTGSQRLGVSVVLGLFVLGLVILLTVDEADGIAAAGRT
jgi:UMF1 family MFS transporter